MQMRTVRQKYDDIILTLKCMGRILSIARSNAKTELCIEVVIAIGRSGIMIASAMAYKSLVDVMVMNIKHNYQWHNMTLVLTGYIMLVMMSQIILQPWISGIAGSLASMKCSYAVQQLIMHKKYVTDQVNYDNPKYKNKVAKAEIGASDNAYDIIRVLIMSVSQLVTCVGFVFVLMRYNVMTAILVVVISVLSCIMSKKASDYKTSFIDKNIETVRKKDYYERLLISKDAAAEIRTYDAGQYLLAMYNEEHDKYIRAETSTIIKQLVISALIRVWASLIYCVSMLHFINAAYIGTISLGEYTLYTNAVSTVNATMQTVIRTTTGMIGKTRFIDYLISYLDEPSSIMNEDNINKGVMMRKQQGKHLIEFNDVSFAYPGANSMALKDVSFQVLPGECIALVGLNGSGKTTLIKILMRIYDPEKGKVYIDGVDISAYSPYSLYKSFGVVFQTYGQYALTIKENIWLGEIDKEMEYNRMTYAADMCGLRKFIEELPDKYDTQLIRRYYKGSTDLSVGQWQRLALARTLYRDSEILILDEPSASMDVETEYRLYNDLKKMREGRTTILISHRLSSTRMCDRVLFLQNGRILESGSPEELYQINGEYARLYKMQSKRYAM